MKIVCKNTLTGRTVVFKSVKNILKNINRDRSKEWTPYDRTDWQEGLEMFTEYKLKKN